MDLVSLIFPLAMAASAVPPPDTCAMAAQAIHTHVARLLIMNQNPTGPRGREKKSKLVSSNVLKAQKSISNYRVKKAAQKGIDANRFAAEPPLFTAYRLRNEVNPCDHLKAETSRLISQNQSHIKNQCLNNSNPYAAITYPGLAWNSESFIQEGGILMFSQCYPNQNIRALFLKHQVSNAYDVGPDRLCRAAWQGLVEAWGEIKYCLNPSGWFDIKKWANGEIVKVSAPN